MLNSSSENNILRKIRTPIYILMIERKLGIRFSRKRKLFGKYFFLEYTFAKQDIGIPNSIRYF